MTFQHRLSCITGLAALCSLAGGAARAQDSESLAKQLANPVASLVSVPFQLNYDENIGPDGEGSRVTMNIQPVIPFSIGEDWNLISRTIIPIVSQDDIYPGAGSQDGLGDVVQSLFFSPKQPTSGGLIWGVGPAFLLPTGTDSLLSAEKWGAGPTGVVLLQQGRWTIGGLANHIWSFAGDDDRADVNQTFLQPFLTYTTPDAWSFTLQTESTYNWETEEWTVPVHLMAAKLVTIDKQPISIGAGIRYWAESPAGAPDDWGARLMVTYLFPKG